MKLWIVEKTENAWCGCFETEREYLIKLPHKWEKIKQYFTKQGWEVETDGVIEYLKFKDLPEIYLLIPEYNEYEKPEYSFNSWQEFEKWRKDKALWLFA